MEADLSYCVPRGIPLSSFQGRPALRPGVDPEWTQQDRELVHAYLRRQADTCPDCGTRPAEWAADKYAYIATRRYCPGCDLVSQERDQIPEQAKGVHAGLVPRALAGDDE